MSEHDTRGQKSRVSEAGPLTRLADMPVNIQTTSQSASSTRLSVRGSDGDCSPRNTSGGANSKVSLV